MKRFFTLVAVAVLTTAFATSAFAVGWGPNGMYGKADPNAQPVGPSSTPSTHPASAPIINPPDPTKDLGFVPGSYNDPAVRARLTQAQLEARKAKAKAAVEGRRYDPKDGAKFAPRETRDVDVFGELCPWHCELWGAANASQAQGVEAQRRAATAADALKMPRESQERPSPARTSFAPRRGFSCREVFN